MPEQTRIFVDRLNRGLSIFPKVTREQIREAIKHYISEHAVPSDFGQMFWNINYGTAKDMNAIFDAIRDDLATRRELGQKTQDEIDSLRRNLVSRISDAAKDANDKSDESSDQ